jgi:chromosome segregation ATPase
MSKSKTGGLILYIFTFLFITRLVFSQNLENINQKIDSLKSIEIELKNNLNYIKSELQNLQNEKLSLTYRGKRKEGIKVSLSRDTHVLNKPDIFGKISAKIKKGTKVTINGYSNKYYQIYYGDEIGYIYKKNVPDNKELKKLRSEMGAIEKKKQAENREKFLKKKYNKTTAHRILTKTIWIGMTSEMAEESWGKPTEINRSVYRTGIHEQWVYSEAYLYFKDDILTSWQDTR